MLTNKIILDFSIYRYLIVLFLMTSNVCLSQTQAPSIQSGVTFQWSNTQPNLSNPATIESVTIDGACVCDKQTLLVIKNNTIRYL